MNQTKQLSLAALFAGAITLVTAYVLHIPIPTGGYIHLGDALIYLVACLLPTPYAIGAAVVGAGLADLLTAPMWVLPTIVIKGLIVLFFTSKQPRILCPHNMVAVVLAGILSPIGYGIASAMMMGSVMGFIPQVLGTSLQSIGSGVVFFVLASGFERSKVRLD
ncbi:MAG: TIGR04002 family protein [Eubacteriales bacterium]